MFICSDSDSLVCERSWRRSKLRVRRAELFIAVNRPAARVCFIHHRQRPVRRRWL